MQKKPPKIPVHRPPPPKHVRIIGGQWKRSQLPVLDALGLRPTPDRVRETVFNWISHLWANDWQDATVLDLFTGSGALGFEAASRGAAAVTLVDSHPKVVAQL
jgi:16S rRNA (guanine(966)-N(2))-methyltransferase RsmD